MYRLCETSFAMIRNSIFGRRNVATTATNLEQHHYQELRVNTSFNKIKIKLAGENITITKGENNCIEMNVTWVPGWLNSINALPILKHSSDGTVNLDSQARVPFFGLSGVYNIDLKLPAHVYIKTEMFGGNLKLFGMTGQLDAYLTGGSIDGHAALRNAKFTSLAGSVDFKGLIGDCKVKALSNINLSFDRVRRESKIDLECTSGNVTLYLPNNVANESYTQMGEGRVPNNVGAYIKYKTLFGSMSVFSHNVNLEPEGPQSVASL